MSAVQQTRTEPGGRLVRLCQYGDCMEVAAFEAGLTDLVNTANERVDFLYACRAHVLPLQIERIERVLSEPPPPD